MPTRTCIGCRSKNDQQRLLRMTYRSGEVVFTIYDRWGRGAYLCPDVGCMEKALKKHALNRAFKRNILQPKSSSELYQNALKALRDQITPKREKYRARMVNLLESSGLENEPTKQGEIDLE